MGNIRLFGQAKKLNNRDNIIGFFVWLPICYFYWLNQLWAIKVAPFLCILHPQKILKDGLCLKRVFGTVCAKMKMCILNYISSVFGNNQSKWSNDCNRLNRFQCLDMSAYTASVCSGIWWLYKYWNHWYTVQMQLNEN